MRCGRQIQLLNPNSNPALSEVHGSEQRGFQCIVCGQITCFGCSDNRYRCNCGGNAWIARVYKGSVTGSITVIGPHASPVAWYAHD